MSFSDDPIKDPPVWTPEQEAEIEQFKQKFSFSSFKAEEVLGGIPKISPSEGHYPDLVNEQEVDPPAQGFWSWMWGK